MDPLTSALASQYQGAPPELDKMRTIGLIAALTGNKQLAGAGDALMGNVQQQQQYAMQAPHMQAQTAKLQQEVQAAGPQQSLGGQTPSNYEMLTKRQGAAKFAANPATGALYDVRTGKTAGGGGGGAPGGLSGPALDQIAEQFHTTGQLPPTGMGAAGMLMRKQIINRASELHPDANLAGNKADYKADSASLGVQKKILDNAESWERTGKANLNILLGVAQNLKDTGSPWINRPVRTFMEKGVGDPNQTAFRAAHATVVNEYAKILSGAQGSGSVTEGARHEAESMLPLDATWEQLSAAAKILDTDAGNRIGSLRQQVATIRGRTGGQSTQAAAAPLPAEPKVRKFTRGPDGKLKEIP